MWNVPFSLMKLNNWSPAGSAVLGGHRINMKWTFDGRSTLTEGRLGDLTPVFSLLTFCVMMECDQPASCICHHALPYMLHGFSVMIDCSQINPFPLECFLSKYFITATEKKMNTIANRSIFEKPAFHDRAQLPGIWSSTNWTMQTKILSLTFWFVPALLNNIDTVP